MTRMKKKSSKQTIHFGTMYSQASQYCCTVQKKTHKIFWMEIEHWSNRGSEPICGSLKKVAIGFATTCRQPTVKLDMKSNIFLLFCTKEQDLTCIFQAAYNCGEPHNQKKNCFCQANFDSVFVAMGTTIMLSNLIICHSLHSPLY